MQFPYDCLQMKSLDAVLSPNNHKSLERTSLCDNSFRCYKFFFWQQLLSPLTKISISNTTRQQLLILLQDISICQEEAQYNWIPRIVPVALSSSAKKGKYLRTGIEPTFPNFSILVAHPFQEHSKFNSSHCLCTNLPSALQKD